MTSYAITLEDCTPSARYPPTVTPWTQAQIGYAATRAGPFETIDTITLPDPDPDPSAPATRNLTTLLSPAPSGWFQVTFLDAVDTQDPTDPVFAPAVGSSLAVAELKARVECDLDDTALQTLIDTNEQEIIARYGPYRDPTTPITEALLGRRRRLDLARPIDDTEPVVVVEVDDESTETTLDTTDYRVWGDRFLERLSMGTNRPERRSRWAPRVVVTYVPQDDTPRRDEVTVKLVMLSIEYKGVATEKIGDVETSYGASRIASELLYTKEREALLESLQPRGAVMIR